MKIVCSWNRFNSSSSSSSSSSQRGCYYRALRVLFYSTETVTSTPPSTSTSKDTLYKRISPVGDPRVSIVPVLDKWIEEGKSVKREDLRSMIKQLRLYKRFKHALEISQWMSDRRYFVLSPGEISVRLDLISRVHGLEHAENYFESIPNQSKVFQTYGALLNCYARGKSVEQAEALMQKMRDLGFARDPLNYNVLLNLYSQVGQHEKLDTLMQEMKEKGIHWDKFTFSIRLSAYAATSDIDGMVKILKMMEEDSQVIMDWNCYAVAANGYIKAGLKDRALEMIKKSEELITGKKRRVAYEFLLTLYTSIGRKDELYRIWNLYKSFEKVYNTGYCCMISSLLKLDDISGAEKILEEWKSGGTTYDFRIPNLLIFAYCKKGHLEKAEKLVNEAVEKGKKPYANTWNCLATGYLEDDQIPKAVETLKKAILARRSGWKPNRDTLAACLEYMKGQEDVEGAEELLKFLGYPGPSSMDVWERLLNYIEDGKPASAPVNEMDDVGLDDIDEATP
ncbi:Pentatricopeptide repeat [Macleaya cordata]|uniref:Pentatricopeptide repeat n=1 Tax=Macleaya cordata TaxID=56857 RepID=A0A200QWZ8_MACCD|nr:Pentatricopeptide repeat [Macleaya cordata]